MQQTLQSQTQSKIAGDKTPEFCPQTWDPSPPDKTPIGGDHQTDSPPPSQNRSTIKHPTSNIPSYPRKNPMSLRFRCMHAKQQKNCFPARFKLPILPKRRLYGWEALALLGKLYLLTLARQDLRCHRTDKSLHSPTLSHRSHIGQQAPTRQD